MNYIGLFILCSFVVVILLIAHIEAKQEEIRRKNWKEYRKKYIRTLAESYVGIALTQQQPMVYLRHHCDDAESGSIQETAILTAMDILSKKKVENDNHQT